MSSVKYYLNHKLDICIHVLACSSFSYLSNDIVVECSSDSDCPNDMRHCVNGICAGNKEYRVLPDIYTFNTFFRSLLILFLYNDYRLPLR